jgi:DNA invertase Pin-like site-specific DNA recombinase
MNGIEKIRSEHREKRAFVYARQSTPAQVLQHHTSTERQLELTQLAARLGWAPTHIELVADDLGRSGKFSENRDGFQRLAAEVSMGRVGAIVSLDAASRLARSSADWHRLLEIASITRTLLIDEQSVYDPRDPNDRLLLGMKGTMADFELVWLRQRMEGGRWHLARKGQYRAPAPIGYVYDDGRLVKDPDEEIRKAVELLFEQYRIAGSCRDVAKHFHDHGLQFPARPIAGDRSVRWTPLRASRVLELLRNPAYAGVYAFGRTRHETTLVEGRRHNKVRRTPQEQWPVSIRDAHPGYISWDEFMANQQRVSESATRRRDGNERGAAREGGALLQGLLLCGHCSHRMQVRYAGNGGRYPVYECNRMQRNGLDQRCVHASGKNIDSPIVELVLQALSRDNLDAATRVVELIEQEDAALEQQWRLRFERARYEARRAERQYNACDPENRVVARTLETRWNDKLVELEQLERDYAEVKNRKRIELSDLERRRILELAKDLPRLWRSSNTTDRDRKLLLRLLVEEIAVFPIEVPQRAFRLRVLWHTQAVTEIEVERPGRHGRSREAPSWRVLTSTAPDRVAQ